MAADLTTLQIARRIADAVVIAYEGYSAGFNLGDDRPDHEHPPTQAVLRVLHETGSSIHIWGKAVELEEQGP